MIEGFIDSRKKQYNPIRKLDVFAKTFLQVRGMLKCNKPFTVSSIPQIIDLAFYDIKSVEIRTFSSTVFLNKNR